MTPETPHEPSADNLLTPGDGGDASFTPYPSAVVRERPPSAWRPRRTDAKSTLVVVAGMVVLGAAAGVVWYLVAPRLGYRADASGDFILQGPSEPEALVGADGWFALIAAVSGLLAAIGAWTWRAARGPAVLVALAVGGLLAGLLGSWIGHLLGPGPTAAEVTELSHHVGTVIHAPLRLRGKVTLVVEPFVAVAAYVVFTGFSGRDDLGRGNDE